MILHARIQGRGRRQKSSEEANIRRIRAGMIFHAGAPDPLEWLFAALKTGWGLWLLCQPQSFAVAPHLYRYVLVIPEPVWALLWLGTGIAQGRAWYLNATAARWGLSLLGTFLWTAYGALMFAGDQRTGSLVFVGILAAFQSLAAYWLSPRLPARGQGADDDGQG